MDMRNEHGFLGKERSNTRTGAACLRQGAKVTRIAT